MIDAKSAQDQVNNFLTTTEDARAISEMCRDYFDHKQWTDEELAELKRRKQAPIVVNRVRPKIKGLVGLYNLRNTDPKAYPRTQKHEKAAHAATDALRFVADNNNFDDVKLEVAEEAFVEGYSGVEVPVKEKNGVMEIEINHIPWDRIYFEPHSRKKDFSDARFKGYWMWMDKEQAEEMFPGVDFDKINDTGGSTHETNEDRPRWLDKDKNRIRIAKHYFIHKGVWHVGYLTESTWLVDPIECPYFDEDGDPACILELVSLNVDRDNNRYGEAYGYLSQQKELNHRRSKALFLNSARQTYGRRGAVKDIPKLKRELAKPDGHVEFDGEKFGEDFGVLPTNDMQRGQIELYQDAKAELDAVGFNAQLAGERQNGDLSGRAIERLQAAGNIELNQDYNQLSGWEKRVYRQIWARVKQFWTEERWIRVTDDQDALRWVGLNTQLTAQKFLEEKINDDSLPLSERQAYAASYQFLINFQPEGLNQIVGSENEVADLDVDIIIDQSFDVINIQEEQFRLLVQFAQGTDIDVIELIELSQIRGKEELIEKIEKRRQQAAQAAGNVQQIQAEGEQAKTMKTVADANKSQQEAIQKGIENELLVNNPERVTSVAV